MRKKNATTQYTFLDKIHEQRKNRVQQYKKYAKKHNQEFNVGGYCNWLISDKKEKYS